MIEPEARPHRTYGFNADTFGRRRPRNCHYIPIRMFSTDSDEKAFC
jgi:hypothetical protein